VAPMTRWNNWTRLHSVQFEWEEAAAESRAAGQRVSAG
jgi:hypothetical protein